MRGILAQRSRRSWLSSREWQAAIAAHFTRRNLILLSGVLACIGAVTVLSGFLHRRVDVRVQRPAVLDSPAWNVAEVTPCIGPRGKLIPESPDDQVQSRKLDGPYPQPFAGSFAELGLGEDWTTVDGRYGPYGFSDVPRLGPNPRSEVDWEAVDWGQLQKQCQDANARWFANGHRASFDARDVRLRLRGDGDERDDDGWYSGSSERLGFPKPAEYWDQSTGKTALIIRSYDGYTYTEEDMINIRSFISEAGLQSGGEYTVVLYVNIRDPAKGIFNSTHLYNEALEDAGIPKEFRHLAVLWDDNLLESWYPKVPVHDIMFQINQSLQLFALFYPEFDHFWQLELDIRSLGHTLTWLRALDRWSRNEPRKQSVERASYFYLPASYPSYSAFSSAVNASLDGGAAIWGPLRIPEISSAIGPRPPVERPEDDDFQWGVGEPADLIVTDPCAWVSRMHSWVFRGWYTGPFSDFANMPRMTCPPAIQRSSRQLLLAVHGAQAKLGLALPSESTMPSWALWHGLKISFPPVPHFQRHRLQPRDAEVFFNGGKPGECVKLTSRPSNPEAAAALDEEISRFLAMKSGPDGETWEDGTLDTIPWEDQPAFAFYRGFGCGEAFNNQLPRVDLTLGISWWWQSHFPRRIIDAWTHGRWKATAEMPTEQPYMLREHQGELFAPHGWLHPVKTRK